MGFSSPNMIKLEQFNEAFRSGASSLSTLEHGHHEVMPLKSVITKYGPTYILLVGASLTPYWANGAVKNAISIQLTEQLKNEITDKVSGFYMDFDKPVAELLVGKVFTGFNFKIETPTVLDNST